jgi:hypothetical protein
VTPGATVLSTQVVVPAPAVPTGWPSAMVDGAAARPLAG